MSILFHLNFFKAVFPTPRIRSDAGNIGPPRPRPRGRGDRGDLIIR